MMKAIEDRKAMQEHVSENFAKRGIWKRLRILVSQRPEIILAPLLFIVIIAGWEWVVKLLEIPRIVLPAPSRIVRAIITMFTERNLAFHFGITLYETLAGFLIGGITGLLLGALVSQFPLVEKTLYPYIVAFQTLPKVAIAPIVVIWFGFGLASKVIITAMIAFFPLLVNTIAGLLSTEPEYVEMMTGFSASRWQIFRFVKIPMALPFIFAGLDIAGIMSVIGAIVGEFVGARAGLGYVIMYRNFQMDMPGVFAVLIVLSAMGIGIHLIINWLNKKVVFWSKPELERVVGA
jgi:NitT/TauT family transport system permease protein